MSGDGGNPPSLRDLLGAYEKSGLVFGIKSTSKAGTKKSDATKKTKYLNLK
jgi:hypothetical protein